MVKPRAQIRRFDVFAEYNRQRAVLDGMPLDEAEGYSLWLAKLVAARRFGRKPKPTGAKTKTPEKEPPRRGKWHVLDGKPQTDDLFQQEIVERMGKTFYHRVFVPAIRRAVRKGQDYTAIRDSIRSDWQA